MSAADAEPAGDAEEVQEVSEATLLFLRFRDEGDVQAYNQLLERYRRPIYNFVYRSVRDREKAADLTQEVFLRTVQRAHQFQARAKFTTWLYSIARNLCIDESRRMQFRRHRSLDAPLRKGEEKGATFLDRVADRGPVTDRDAIAKELQIQIAEAVELLPPDLKEVFLMRQVQGLRFQDIAEIVDVPLNTVKSRMRYALERLQKTLAEYEDYAKTLK